VTWSRPAVSNMMGLMTQALQPSMQGNASLGALKQISLMVERESLTQTYNDVFLLMAATFIVAIPLTLLLKKPKLMAGSAAH